MKEITKRVYEHVKDVCKDIINVENHVSGVVEDLYSFLEYHVKKKDISLDVQRLLICKISGALVEGGHMSSVCSVAFGLKCSVRYRLK